MLSLIFRNSMLKTLIANFQLHRAAKLKKMIEWGKVLKIRFYYRRFALKQGPDMFARDKNWIRDVLSTMHLGMAGQAQKKCQKPIYNFLKATKVGFDMKFTFVKFYKDVSKIKTQYLISLRMR